MNRNDAQREVLVIHTCCGFIHTYCAYHNTARKGDVYDDRNDSNSTIVLLQGAPGAPLANSYVLHYTIGNLFISYDARLNCLSLEAGLLNRPAAIWHCSTVLLACYLMCTCLPHLSVHVYGRLLQRYQKDLLWLLLFAFSSFLCVYTCSTVHR